MRYPEDKIKEAILPPDLDARDTAIRSFYSSTSPDDTLMPLAIRAIERYGRTTAFSFTHYLNLLPEAMQAAVSEVLDHLSDYRKELATLMTENFHIVAKEAIPVDYREVA
jgi:hypothetical protein